MKKKILIAISNLNCGGKEKSLISLLQSIDYHKFEVDLLLTNADKNGEFFTNYLPDNVQIMHLPDKYKWLFIPRDNYLKHLKYTLRNSKGFLKMIFYTMKGVIQGNMASLRQEFWESCSSYMPEYKINYDVAIDYSGGHKQLILDKVSANKKITWIHSDYKVYGRNKEMDSDDYNRLDAIATVSKTTYDIFISEFPELKEKTYVIPNINIKSKILEMANEYAEFDNDYLGMKILDITRLDPNKGIDIAIKACKELVDEGYNIKWYILGDGPEKVRLQNLIKQNGLEHRFILLGLHSNPYPFIKRADLIVHCSLFEGKSVAIDEAMLLEKPIILTNYPTAKDQIENGINGLICDSSVDGIVKAVSKLINDIEYRSKITQNLKGFDLPVKDSTNVFYKIIES